MTKILFRGLLTLLCVLAFCSTGSAQTGTKREVLSLDKGWRFHKGDIAFPVIKGHGASYSNAKAGGVRGAAASNYDDTAWRFLNLPHDWAIEGRIDSTANLSQGYYNRGIGWYRRKFKLAPEDKGKYIELQFDGIATHATIWVNGTVLHRNWCGYTSMYIDITPYATYGDDLNTVAVRVDADAQEGWWYEGAGMYRHTWLVKRSPLHIITDGVFANPVKKTDGQWEIPAEVSLNNSGKQKADGTVEVALYAPDGTILAAKTANISVGALKDYVARLCLTVDNPKLWSPDSPTLYRVKTTVRQGGNVVDETTTRCGFRTMRFDKDTGFWLNGKNIKLKGVCNHQDHAGVGVAMPDALIEFRLRKLKDMGVNAYRASHNPQSKEFMELCDSMGIMVMDENRLFNTSPEYVRQLQWLVRRDRNHPSVIMWSVFNEEPMQGTENGYEMVRRMCAVVKDMDQTRPVTAAMNGGFTSEYNVSQAVDVAGINYQIWIYDRFHKTSPNLAQTSSEDGSAFMVRGEYTTDHKRNIIDSYDSEAAGWGATHRQAWKEIDKRPWLAGCFYWTGFDYHGEPTPFQWPSVSSFFGIMDLCGFPKSAYYIHQAQWRKDLNVLELIPHWDWPADSIGRPIKVMAMSNADKVKLVLNGKLVSEQTVDPYEMNTWMVPYKPGKLEAIGYKDGKVVSRAKVETTTKPVRIKLTSYRGILSGDGRDATPVTVELTDSKGRHVPTANNMVEFAITGPGRIIGLGNGNPNCHEAEKGNRHSMFNGLAQVIIQTDDKAGEIKLTATANGLKPCTLTIPVKQVVQEPSVPVVGSIVNLRKWYQSPTSASKPDVNKKVADNDMNTWEPTSTGNATTLKDAGYVVWRTKTTLPYEYQKTGGTIILRKVHGKAEVWLNGLLLGTKDTVDEKDIMLDIPTDNANCEIRVLFNGAANSQVGLKGAAMIQGK